MRTKLLGAGLALLGLLQVISLSTGARAVSSTAAADPMIVDASGDATDVVVPTGGPEEMSVPTLDVVSADIAVDSEALTTVVTVLDMTAEAPPGATGKLFRWFFTYAGMEFHTRGSESATGAEQFRLYDPANVVVPCPGCTGAFDYEAETVTVVVPLAVLNAKIGELSAGAAPAIGLGSEFSALSVLAQREASVPPTPAGTPTSGVTPSADTADTDRKYRVGGGPGPVPPALGPANADEIGDATVIAVIDFNMVPYHWDFDGAYMPQHRDTSSVNDLPLSSAPSTWLSGFPAESSFASFSSLPLGLKTSEPGASLEDAAEADAEAWESVPTSSGTEVHYRWVPGTKVIGAVDFGGSTMRGVPDDHGVGVTSVSTGNLHGTCPECLLVFVNIASDSSLASTARGSVSPLDRESLEAAVAWATSQPWIDVVTNSWGANIVGGYVRDNVYGSDRSVAGTRAASERGQTVFFSAGNGIENAFVVANTTYFSALKGPDWMMTVGAIAPPPSEGNYTGAGKPVDLSSYGSNYPAAYTAVSVSGTGATGFSGTSNATPVVAGLYARSLLAARMALPGPSRAQSDGVVAVGSGGVACGAARAACELGDGVLTASELRQRLLEGATPTEGVSSVGGLQDAPQAGDQRFASEGHGAYRARQSGLIDVWMADQERILGPLFGRSGVAARPAGEREWMTVDSACRQHLWGSWSGGYYLSDAATPLAEADFEAWPLRSAIQSACPSLVAPPTP
jgi:Subtilase family